MRVTHVRKLDMTLDANRRDRLPAPDAEPRPRGIPARDWPPGLTQSEAHVLRAMHVIAGIATTSDVLAIVGGDERATLKALDRLVGSGLVAPLSLDSLNAEFRLTTPAGRDLAAVLADH